ncbi:hypothetical protein GWI33_004148 [Rhynchophorus ferrugineus]|uniref:RNA helicase n=1 Tax=Rhynchophorus ferrugineus TaxID=354439 RepID=A0A834HQQ5_RHYFE|nr:hypothetical protein GWI33_004158 [Rhynchophorus ferrugineus]KAF7262761.1 hypothetical protein GWI33_004148 [Rhynchophorus ferrugineus]
MNSKNSSFSQERHNYQENSSERFRRPKGLKGREIGLWYAARSRARRSENSNRKQNIKEERHRNKNHYLEKKPLGSILLSDGKKKYISRLLNETSSLINGFDQSDSAFKASFFKHVNGSIIERLELCSDVSICFKNEQLDKLYFEELESKESNSVYKKMLKSRIKLPSMNMKDQILSMINDNQVTVISGETGCGKTTQVAQFILDYFIQNLKGSECKIVCTQPRRISAISIAERVAEERAEVLGNSVGFQIRLEQTKPRERGSILFCTTGVLLKIMETDPALSEISHLIIDEIHERDVISDFLITVLKDVIHFRSDLKVILMSATLNADAFSRYYNNAPHIHIPGFTYPVTEYFLEDVIQKTRFSFSTKKIPIWVQKKHRKNIDTWYNYIKPYLRQLAAEKKYDRFVLEELQKPESEDLNVDLIYELLKYICTQERNDGAILVFVTGFSEIQTLTKRMEKSIDFPRSKFLIFPLHSQLPTVDQKRIFNPAPDGMTKIIIATNIAETSITIDDVTVVINCGYIKLCNLDPETGIETLKPEWVSCANAAQRKGRAGRVKPGICYHLFNRVRFDSLQRYQKPEVLRKRLENVILQLKMLRLGKAEIFLAKLMDPPETTSIKNSLSLLERLGALDEDEILTPLGFHMASLPIGVQCAKMIIMGALFNCLDPVLSVAAALDFKDGFLISTDDQKAADKARLELSDRSNSDHLLMHFAIKGFEQASNPHTFCYKYFLSAPTLKLLSNMRKQFAQMLFDMKFIADSSPRSARNNLNSNNLSLVKAVICSGLYPNVAIICTNKAGKPIKLRSVTHEIMEFHPKSILHRLECVSSPLVMYHHRLRSSKLFIHEGTIVYPLPLVFFGDNFEIMNTDFTGVSINGTMRFLSSESTASIVSKLRYRLSEILEYKVSNPGYIDWTKDTTELKILRAIMEMITSEDMENMDLSDYDDC